MPIGFEGLPVDAKHIDAHCSRVTRLVLSQQSIGSLLAGVPQLGSFRRAKMTAAQRHCRNEVKHTTALLFVFG